MAAPGGLVRLPDVVLLSEGHAHDVDGVSLVLGAAGLAVQAPGGEPHVVAWADVRTWAVRPWDAPDRPGACLSVTTGPATYHLVVPGADPAELHDLVASMASPAERHHDREAAFKRVEPVLVVVLVVLLVVAVTAVLLQSAGVVHLPVLGGP